MDISGIYQITSKKHPKKIYIGSAIDIHTRWATHKWELRERRHGNSKLQKHFDKYGCDDLSFSILISCDKDELLIKEQFFIDSLNPWFNICKVANSKIGVPCPQSTRDKISAANKGKKRSEETIIKMKKRVPWNKGLKGVQKCWYKGLPKELHPCFGKKQSKETKEKRAKKLIGRPVSEKTLAILSKNWGKPQSAESNKKKGDHARGKKQSEDTIRKRVIATRKTKELKKQFLL